MIPASYIDYTRSRESGGDPFAKNPRSSATGLYQFTDGTWADMMRLHPELGLTPDGRTQEDQQTRAMQAFTADNEGVLRNAGVPISRDSLYLAHRLGAGGAVKAFSSDPKAQVADVFPDIMRANPDLRGKTIGDLTGNKMAYNTDDEDSTGALSTRTSLGPGVLFAGGRDTNTPQWDNALINAGAALASITSPQQGAAIAQLSKPRSGDNFSTAYDKDSGVFFRINKKTGRVETVRNPAFQPEPDKETTAWNAARIKANSDLSDKVDTDAAGAQSQLANVGHLRQALSDPNVYQGTGGEAVADLKKLASTMGFSVEGTTNADVARSLFNQLTLSMRQFSGGMPGSLSDKDLAFLKQIPGSLSNTPEANQEILSHIEKVYQRQVEVQKMRDDYLKEHGRIDDGFRQKVNKWANENRLFADAPAAPAAAPATPNAAPALPKGVKSIQIIQ